MSEVFNLENSKSTNNYKSIVVELSLIDPKTDKVIHHYIRTIDGKQRREWLNKTIMWAMFQGFDIEITRKKENQ